MEENTGLMAFGSWPLPCLIVVLSITQKDGLFARVGEFGLPYNCRFGGWMKSLLVALLMAFFPAASPAQQQTVGEKLPSASLQGFTASSAQAERTWESKFRAIPNTDNLREYMRL